MTPRRVLPGLLVLAVVALHATACGRSPAASDVYDATGFATAGKR